MCKSPQLAGVIEAHGVIDSVEAPQAIRAKIGAANAINPSADPEELKKAYRT